MQVDKKAMKEFLAKRKRVAERRQQPNNVRGGNDGKLVHSTGRKVENDNV